MPDHLLLRFISAFGLAVFVAVAWAGSEQRRRVDWRLVAWAIALQLALGIFVLDTPLGRPFFDRIADGFNLISAASDEGARFVFGNLTQFFLIDKVMVPGPNGLETISPFPISAVIAFKVLSTIVFVCGLSAILQHLGVIQFIVGGIAWLMRRTLRTSGAETFGVSLQIFTGVESASALGAYLPAMTRSEIFAIMVSFLASIAASVMVAYASFGAEPGHLLTASLMSAPAAMLFAKVMIPETGTPLTSGREKIRIEVSSRNIFDAAAQGAQLGVSMALNVGAMLIIFIGLIYLCNQATIFVTGLELPVLLGYAFRPVAWLMGIPSQDLAAAGQLLAVKTVFNEFLAYQQLQALLPTLHPRSVSILTYALCGFSNPGSLGIMIAGLAALAPGRRGEIAQMTGRAFIAGCLATFSTACIAGVLA